MGYSGINLGRFRAHLITALIVALSVSFVVQGVYSYEIKVESEKYVYRPDDTIVITAQITNDMDEKVNFVLEVCLKDFNGKFSSYQIYYPLTLEVNESIRLELFRSLVDDRLYSGLYVVSYSILEGKFRVYQGEIYFKVEGTPEDLSLTILLARDPEFKNPAITFVKGEKVYMNYLCSVQNVSISALLTLPDNTTRQVNLPGNVTAKIPGVYELAVIASAPGYRNTTLLRYFSVFSEELMLYEKENSSILLYISKEEVAEGESLKAYGNLIPPHSDVNVMLTYSMNGKAQTTRSATTDEEGRFSDNFIPNTSGNWSVTASWAGDSNHLGASSQSVYFKVAQAAPTSMIALATLVAILVVAGALFIFRRRKTGK